MQSIRSPSLLCLVLGHILDRCHRSNLFQVGVSLDGWPRESACVYHATANQNLEKRLRIKQEN